MGAKALKYSHHFDCRIHIWILAVIWIVGFVSGTFLTYLTGTGITSLMRTAAENRVSIIWLVICNIFPLLSTAFAVYYSVPVIPECLLGLKAFSGGFVMMGLLIAFGSGGWLVGLLLLFSFGLSNMLTLWIFLSAGRTGYQIWGSRFIAAVSAAFVVTVVDYLYIAPFLAYILDQF